MKANNPMADKVTRDKMAASLKGRPFRGRMGNGHVTRQQWDLTSALLFLGYECQMEKGIPTIAAVKMFPEMKLPTCYKPDIMHVAAKLAIEVDGKSHLLKNRAAEDAKKTAVLSALGWSVLRFTNAAVDRNLTACAQMVASTISKLLGKTTTSPTDS
jgi:hypothetical protein